MKKYLNYFLLSVTGVALLASCTVEIENIDEVEVPIHNVIKFKASPISVDTKATLTPNAGDTEFSAAWEDGDLMVLNASSVAESFDEDAISTWDDSDKEFTADFGGISLPSGSSAWSYKAWYPVDTDVPFGANRVQNGNAYNSEYDVMYGELEVADGKIGKDGSDEAIVVEMNRLTGIAYFHITGGPDEEVIGAILSTNENLAAQTVNFSGGGTSLTPTNGTNAIYLSFSSSPNAQDFKLWFNVLPGDYTGLSLTIYTATKKATISASAITFTAGKLNKVVKNISTWTPQVYYSKVTAVGNLTDSNYLIVYEPDKVAFNGGLANVDVGNNVTSVIQFGSYIARTNESEASMFAIASLGSSNYSIRAASGDYIGRETASNGMDRAASAYNNTITFTSGNAIISGTGGYQLRFNPASGGSNYRFRYYASDKQQDVALYKFNDTRLSQTLSFPNASYDAIYPGDFDAPVLSGANTAVTYTSSVTSVATVNSSTGAITIAGIGTTIITAKAAGDGAYKPATTSYTLVVASAPITSIAVLKANLATDPDDFDVTLTNAVVTYKTGNNAYLEDASAGIYMYNCASELAVGDKFNGDVSLTAKIYNGQPEITAFDASSATKDTGAEPYLTEVSISTLVANIDDYDGMRIKLAGVQLGADWSGATNVTVSRGGSSITAVSKDSDVDFEKDDIADIIGFPVNYNGNTPRFLVFDDAHVDIKSTTWNLKGIAVTNPPTKTSYIAGEYFATAGLVVTATYEDSTEEYTKYVDVTSSCTFTPSTSTALTTLDTVITITYGGKTTSQSITVGSSGSSWTKVTTVDQITGGGTFIIGYQNPSGTAGVIVPMRQEGNSLSTSADGYVYSGTTSGNSTSGTLTMAAVMASSATAAYETVIEAGSSSGTIVIKYGTNYIGAGTGSSGKVNKVRLFTTKSSDNTDYTPTISDGVVTLTLTGKTLTDKGVNYHPIFQYNSTSGQERFATYWKGAQQNLVLYKKGN